MTKESLQAINEIERVRKEVSAFIILKDGKPCGRVTARNIKRTNTTHIAFMIYSYASNGIEIAAYERISGFGFNREVFGIHYVLQKLQGAIKDAFGIELQNNNLRVCQVNCVWVFFYATFGNRSAYLT